MGAVSTTLDVAGRWIDGAASGSAALVRGASSLTAEFTVEREAFAVDLRDDGPTTGPPVFDFAVCPTEFEDTASDD